LEIFFQKNTPMRSVNNILIFLLLCIVSVLHTWSEYITILFPKYADVLPLINVFLLSALLQYGVSLTSNILYLIEKRKFVAKVQFVIVISYACLLLLNIYLNLDIVYVVWSMCSVLLLQILINIGSLVKFEKINNKSELIKFLTLLLGSFIYFGFNEFIYDDAASVFYYLLFATFVLFIKFDKTWENFKHIAKRQFST